MATMGFTTTRETFVQIDALPGSETGVGFAAKSVAPAFKGKTPDTNLFITGATVLFAPYYRAGRKSAALRAHGVTPC